ncbi:hypothetical protein J6590_053634 [Homalodisca vitripennis]|nr:hypothetical protein J6590_053634 [Homalodisca vitripennis]
MIITVHRNVYIEFAEPCKGKLYLTIADAYGSKSFPREEHQIGVTISKTTATGSNAPPCRTIEVGTRVQARHYREKPNKWSFGQVRNEEGNLHCRVFIDDGQIWQCHID